MDGFDGRLRSGTLYYYADVAARALIARLTMKDFVDGDALNRAVVETIRRHPYITQSLREQNGCFYLTDNDNPMPVLNTDEELVLGGEMAGGHLYGITWHGQCLNLYFYHGLIDGMAAQRVMETLLYYYFSFKNNREYDPDGIWINDGTVYEGCEEEPFEAEYELQPEGAAGGDSSEPDGLAAEDTSKQTSESRSERDIMRRFEGSEPCLHLSELDAGWDKNEHTGFEVRVDSSRFMDLVKREGLTPTSVAAVFLSHAAMRLYPDNTLPVRTAMPVNIRRAIGMPNTHRNATLDIGLYYDPSEMDGRSIGEQGRILRAQLKSQTTPEHLRSKANASIVWARGFEEAGSYEKCREAFSKIKRASVDTFFLSYVGRLHLPGYEDGVQAVSLVSHSRNSIIIDLTEMGGCFIFGFRQCVPSPFFVEAFTEVLRENGIPAECSEGESYTLPYVEFRETLGLK